MKRYTFFYLLIFLSGIIISINSCKEEVVEPPINDDNLYFPSNIGHFIVYDVDTSYYDKAISEGKTARNHYQIKEIVESDFTDGTGRNTQRIERYFKINDTLNWELKDVWYSNLTSDDAEKVEENQRYVKLRFPIVSQMHWNGNLYNILDQEEYRYTSINTPYTVNGIVFPNTVTVTQIDDFSVIHRNYAIEVYAKNVGMIYKKTIIVTKEPDYTSSGKYVFGDTLKHFECEYRVKSYN